MKKTLIALVLLIAILAAGCGSAAPAETGAPADASAETTQPDPAMEPETPAEDVMPELTPSYVKNQLTVTGVDEEIIETTIDPENPDNKENIINFLITPDTLIYDSQGEKKELSDIQKGALISVYTDAFSPAPLILPPQYQADVIILEDPEAETPVFNHVDTFIMNEGILVDAGNSLALNISEEVPVVDKEGNEADAGDLAGKDLLVFYDVSTRSIPAQTTPLKIVVLGENHMALANINAE